MPKVLITGITGFLGSHIAIDLIQNGFEVIGLKRQHSNIWRCKDIESNIEWVSIDDGELWKKTLSEKKPHVIIHSAWIGVEAHDREDWAIQVRNIALFTDILEIARTCEVKKVVFLGSQAEYGNIDGKVSELHSTKSINAYGAVKLCCLEIFKTFCQQNNINWIWLRLFSIFGELENHNWLIPSVIQKMQITNQMDFTLGEQKYAYLYVKDFAIIIRKTIEQEVSSDIYNVSSNELHQLRALLQFIRSEVNPTFTLNFGVLPYRSNQSMHIEGDMSKLIAQIGNVEFTNFKVALQSTIHHYISK